MAATLQAWRRRPGPGYIDVEADVLHLSTDSAATVQAVAVTRARRRADALGNTIEQQGSTTVTVGSNRLTTVRMRLS